MCAFCIYLLWLCDSHASPASRPRQGWRSLCAAGCSSASAGRARLCARLRPSAAAGGRAEARRVPLGFGWVCGHFAFPGPGLDNPRGLPSSLHVCLLALARPLRVRAGSPGFRDRRRTFHPRPRRNRRRDGGRILRHMPYGCGCRALPHYRIAPPCLSGQPPTGRVANPYHLAFSCGFSAKRPGG